MKIKEIWLINPVGVREKPIFLTLIGFDQRSKHKVHEYGPFKTDLELQEFAASYGIKKKDILNG